MICFVSLSVSFNTVVFEPAQAISKTATTLHDLWPSAKHARHKMTSWWVQKYSIWILQCWSQNWLVETLNGNSVSRLMSNNLWDFVALDDLWCDAQPLHNFSSPVCPLCYIALFLTRITISICIHFLQYIYIYIDIVTFFLKDFTKKNP
jgi:hypothetical protein